MRMSKILSIRIGTCCEAYKMEGIGFEQGRIDLDEVLVEFETITIYSNIYSKAVFCKELLLKGDVTVYLRSDNKDDLELSLPSSSNAK